MCVLRRAPTPAACARCCCCCRAQVRLYAPRLRLVRGPVVTELRQLYRCARSAAGLGRRARMQLTAPAPQRARACLLSCARCKHSLSAGDEDGADSSSVSTLTTRLWRGRGALEVEWTIGRVRSMANWEAFVRYNTSINSGECALRAFCCAACVAQCSDKWMHAVWVMCMRACAHVRMGRRRRAPG